MEREEKFIISSPANIPWIFLSEHFSVKHMFKNKINNRNYFVIEATNFWDMDIIYDKPTVSGIERVYLSHSNTVEKNILTLFSVFFWKRFEFNGLFSISDRYYLPDILNTEIKYKWLSTNNHNKRIDSFIDLNWNEIWSILSLLDKDEHKTNIFFKAWQFYREALVNIDYDPEIAYIDLIRSIEILSSDLDFEYDSFFEWNLQEIYNKIKSDEKLKDFFVKYHGSSTRFCNFILKFLPIESSFRKKSESNRENFWFLFLKQDSIKNILKRTYNLRNKYIHSWLHFWDFVIPAEDWLNELVYSEPAESDGYLKINENLSFLWLERLVRRCLMKYLEN